MYINIFKMARLGRLVAAKDGVRILGRVYTEGQPIRFRLNMNRPGISKMLKLGLLKIAEEFSEKEDEIIKQDESISDNIETEEEPETGLVSGDTTKEDEPVDEDEEFSGSTDRFEDTSGESEEGLEGDLDFTEVEIEEPLVPSISELVAMTLSEIRVISNPLGISSNSKEKLIEKLLAL
jgi:hypothetical protein